MDGGMTRLYGHTAPGGAVGLRLDCHQHPRRREGSRSGFGACVRVAESAHAVETVPDGDCTTRSPTVPICFCSPALLVWTEYATPVDADGDVPDASRKMQETRPGSQSRTSDACPSTGPRSTPHGAAPRSTHLRMQYVCNGAAESGLVNKKPRLPAREIGVERC